MHTSSEKKASASGKKPSGIMSRRGRPVYLMVSLFLLLLLYPVSGDTPWSEMLIRLAYSLILVSAAWAIHTDRRAFFASSVIGLPWLVLDWLGTLTELPEGLKVVAMASLTVFILFLLGMMIYSVMRAEHVTDNTLCRAVSAYLLMGIAWSVMYGMILEFDGGAFSINIAVDAAAHSVDRMLLYLSFCTLTTLGYGDVTPVSSLAQGLTMIEATLGPLYLAILVARLVAIYTRERPA